MIREENSSLSRAPDFCHRLLRNFGPPIALDAAGQNAGLLVHSAAGVPVRLSTSAYQLLGAVQAGMRFDTLAAKLSQRGKAVSAEQVETSYQRLVDRLHDLETQRARKPLPPGFWACWPLFSSRLVGRIAGHLSFLWAQQAIAAWLLTFAAVLYGMLDRGMVSGAMGSSFVPGYLLFLLSLLWHEFGHASACSRFGVAPKAIGLTLYLVFPAFYCDVTPAWQLPRWQRVGVDVGGLYFQLMTAVVYGFIFLVSGAMCFQVAFFFICYSCLISLNPILRCDGYWLLADALGVTRLGGHGKQILRYFYARISGRDPKNLPWPPWVAALLLGYALLSCIVWAFLWTRLSLFVWRGVGDFLAGIAVLRQGGGDLQGGLTSAAFFLLACFILTTLSRHLIHSYRSCFAERRRPG